MKVFLGLGSNVEPRRETISKALKNLLSVGSLEKISPIYETPALLPPEAPSSWNKPFLNLVVQMKFSGDPLTLLSHLKAIEKKLGHEDKKKWAPRNIDLDILLFGDKSFSLPGLQIPHPEMEKRAFVLDPLKDILPSFIPKARQNKNHSPLWMAIANLTPDSFSDGGRFPNREFFSKTILEYEKMGVTIIDLGAESTRPGASGLSADEELARLKPFLEQLSHLYGKQTLKPLISIDTRHVKTAEVGLKLGADILNDVSGLRDPEMLSLLENSRAAYVLTHSLDVPVNPKNILKEDPLKTLCDWLEEKLEILEKHCISWDRIFFDPGIGFGKNPLQCLKILKNLHVFHPYPVRLLVGHSRKSVMGDFSPREAGLRDPETLGISMGLVQQGVDVLRVHNPEIHIRAFRGWSHVTG